MSLLQLFLEGLEVLKREEDERSVNEMIMECVVRGKKLTSIENQDFACLLVRGEEGFLETGLPSLSSSCLDLNRCLQTLFQGTNHGKHRRLLQ